MRVSFVALLLMLASPPLSNAMTQDGATAEAMLASAESAFQRGVAQSDISREVAQRDFALSAAHYQSLVDEYGVKNALLFLNLGNARLLSGDPGRAIASYRRAELLAPSDSDVRSALSVARKQIGVSVPPSLSKRSMGMFQNVLTSVGRPLILYLAIGAWLGAWGFVVIRHATSERVRLPGAPVLFVLALLGAGLLLVEQVFETRSSDAVVVWEQVDGRSGPGIGVYDGSFDKPLPAGVELTVTESRDGWVQAKLADGRSTWLPEDSVEIIR